jgi:hypothetical protein
MENLSETSKEDSPETKAQKTNYMFIKIGNKLFENTEKLKIFLNDSNKSQLQSQRYEGQIKSEE